jgi:hypothetical protein
MMKTKTDINIDAFGALVVYDESGQPVLLSSLWTKNPALLVFVRHFG